MKNAVSYMWDVTVSKGCPKNVADFEILSWVPPDCRNVHNSFGT